jgi:hypothetical protein
MKPCPESVNKAGALLVKVRHAMENDEQAAKVKVEKHQFEDCFAEAKDAIMAAMDDLKADVPTRMEFGPGLVAFHKAWEYCRRGDRFGAFAHTMNAHNEFKKVLDRNKIANPTNDSIAKVIAFVNSR